MVIVENAELSRLHVIIPVARLAEVSDIAGLVSAMLKSNFMWSGSPFIFAVDPKTDGIFLQDRMLSEDVPDEEAFSALVDRAEQALADARNFVKVYCADDDVDPDEIGGAE